MLKMASMWPRSIFQELRNRKYKAYLYLHCHAWLLNWDWSETYCKIRNDVKKLNATDLHGKTETVIT